MRLTTKIVLGIIGAIFLASITCIIVLSIGYEKPKVLTEEFEREVKESNGKRVAISVPSFKNLILHLDISGNENKELLGTILSNIEGCVRVTSAPIDSFNVKLPEGITQDKKIVLIPEALEPYIKWTVETDGTLKLTLKFSEELLHKNSKDKRFTYYRSKIDIIVLSDSIERFYSNVNNVKVDFNGINTGLMDVETNEGDISISNCNVGKLIPKTGLKRSVQITNSKIKDLNIDFSSELHLNTIQSEIETGHFRGNTDTWNVNGKSNFKKIHWVQSDKDNPLNFNLKTDSVTLVFP